MLALYRRHRQDCKGRHPQNSRSSEYDERKKNWTRCECPIFASGTLHGTFKRQNTSQWEWEPARSISAQYENIGTWTGEKPKPPDLPIAAVKSRITISQAVAAFKTERSTAADNTLKKYDLLLKKMQTFADTNAFQWVEQWGPSEVRALRATWEVSPQTAAKNMSTIRSFFEFCLASEWITRNPAKLVKNPRTRDAADKRGEQKLPFSDEELRRMYQACSNEYGKQNVRWSHDDRHQKAHGEVNRYNRRWNGQDLADFISVSVSTGLRISDVATFHIDRLQADGTLRVRTTKAGTHVYTWIPAWLQQRIRERAQSIGPLIFGEHKTADLNVITDLWRRKLIKLWDLCGKWEEKPHPHRFRHSFARIILQQGVSVRDVADLLGNSENMVRKHYSAWLPERQARLTKIMQEAFANRPQP